MVGRVQVENTKHCNRLNIQAWGFEALEKKDFTSFSHDKSIGANDHWEMANLDPSGMVGRIYIGNS